MSTKNKTLAKSLHTITVLANVGRLHLSVTGGNCETAVKMAMETLGYQGASDPYGLAAKAVATLAAQTGGEG